MNSSNQIITAKHSHEFKWARELFTQYAAQLDIDLSFQNFQEELINIELCYSPPEGCLLLALDGFENVIGCVGIRQLTNQVCELKRMFVVKEARGQGVGKKLLQAAIDEAKLWNYHKMRLDSLPSMGAALDLYRAAGFYDIAAYRINPIEGAVFLEKNLHP